MNEWARARARSDEMLPQTHSCHLLVTSSSRSTASKPAHTRATPRQIVDLTKLKINKVSRMKPNLKPVAEALAIAVHDFERGVSEAARMS